MLPTSSDRLKKMAIKQSSSGASAGDKAAAPAAARPGRQAARAAATYSFADSDEDEDAASSDGGYSSDPDEAMSPAPELLKAKAKPRAGAAAAAAGRGKAAAAAPLPKPASPSPRVAFGRTMSSSESPLVEKKAAPKRKPRGEWCHLLQVGRARCIDVTRVQWRDKCAHATDAAAGMNSRCLQLAGSQVE